MAHRRFIALGCIALGAIAGCGGGRSTAQPASTTSGAPLTTRPGAPATASPPTTADTGADPNAPEVNQAGDIPDDQVFVEYSPPSGGFTVKVPEGWARTETGSAVTFTDKLNSIRMASTAAPSAPTVQFAEQTELPTIRAEASGFRAGKVTSVGRKAGPAVLITFGADSAPDPVTGKVVADAVERYEFWRSGTEVVLTLSGPQGADNVDPWRIVTDSFRWR